MKKIIYSLLLWFLAVLCGAGIAVYQRLTGPTYPISGKLNLGNEEVAYKLIRTFGGEGDAKIVIPVNRPDVAAEFSYKRYKSHDDWTAVPMLKTEEGLVAFVPHQPPAGKVMYEISIFHENRELLLTEEPVIIRFKGAVPDWVTILHIIFIFLAFIFSMRTGFEALRKGRYTFAYTVATTLFLLLGGLVFGPIMQKYAFGAYWTGWPFGQDLTDNKTAIALIFWMIALFVQLKNREKKRWAAIASLVLLLTFLIPHSVLGSEIDHTKTTTGQTP
ncbi:MAG TPA: hypothetical protein P5228_10970 [Bacteroidales bacterium]|nr:hypothetical protein [Bacteroidales bacterium]HRZ48646.1 hypothetical protein [Bacteroidales bacterium]